MKINIGKKTIIYLSSIVLLITCFFYNFLDANVRATLSACSIILSILYIITPKRKGTYFEKTYLLFICMMIFFILNKNYDLEAGYYGRVLYLMVSLVFMMTSVNETYWIKKSYFLLKLVGILGVVMILALTMGGQVVTDGCWLSGCEVTLALALANICSQKKFKLVSGILIVLSLLAMFLTRKSGPILFAVCSLVIVVYIFRYQKNNKKQLMKFLSLMLVFIALLIGEVVGIYDYIGMNYTDEVTSGRVTLYDKAIELFLESPIWGLGWAGYRTNSGIWGYEVHNIYLQLLCEVGIIGTVIFTLFFIYVLMHTIQTLSYVRRINDTEAEYYLYFSLFCQLYFLLYGITGNPLYDHNFMLYAYSVAVSRNISNYSKAKVI